MIIHGVLRFLADGAAAAPTPAPGAPGEGIINTEKVLTFVLSKVAPILLAFLGAVMVGRAGKGEVSKVLTSSAIAIVGLVFIAGAVVLIAFGQGIANLLFN